MLIRSIDPLIKETANRLNLSEEVVRDVIMYKFSFLKKFVDNLLVPSYVEPEWGTFYLSSSQFLIQLRWCIARLRRKKKPSVVELATRRFHSLWRIRIPFREYRNRKAKYTPKKFYEIRNK